MYSMLQPVPEDYVSMDLIPKEKPNSFRTDGPALAIGMPKDLLKVFSKKKWKDDEEKRDSFSAYFSHQDCNIIVVNWYPLATWDNYFVAAQNAVRVGQHSGEVLGQKLINELGQSPKQIHAIGFSLGGHLVGHFGRAIKSLTGTAISRVTCKNSIFWKKKI